VRGALLSHAGQRPLEVLTGHRGPGLPSERSHVAIVPLPDVGHSHAEGVLLGVAIVLPRGLDDTEHTHVYRAVGRWAVAGPMLAKLGRAGAVELELHESGPLLLGQKTETWCRASAIWASATPVALDRNPGDLLSDDPAERHEAHHNAERIVADACVRIGLPRPMLVEVSFRPPLVGAAKVDQDHPPFPPRRDRIRRVQVHVRLAFPAPVRGPILLGAGRFLGSGLLRPVESP
jgi:CRISPR-associated protein Csb2